ncbi:MAG: TonB-dependent receptor, partial [Selenomonas artemidis]
VVGLTYEPTDACSFTGRLVWSDKAYIENVYGKGKIEIPAYATVDLRMTYKTRINTVPTKLSLMCYNALNKSYWMGRGGSSTFGLSMPRTWMFSAQFDI